MARRQSSEGGERGEHRPGQMTSNMEERGRQRGGATTTKWAGRDKQHSWQSRINKRECDMSKNTQKKKNKDGKHKVEERRRRSGRVRMNEIKITMERCRRGFPDHLLSSPAVSPHCTGARGPKGLYVQLTRGLKFTISFFKIRTYSLSSAEDTFSATLIL